MKCKSYLLSFAKTKGSIAAVALAAVLMAANGSVEKYWGVFLVS